MRAGSKSVFRLAFPLIGLINVLFPSSKVDKPGNNESSLIERKKNY